MSVFKPSVVTSMLSLFFRPNILFDSSGINFYRSDNKASIVIILDCVLTRCMVNEAPTLILDQVSDLQFPIVEAPAPEFNVFHIHLYFTGYLRHPR